MDFLEKLDFLMEKNNLNKHSLSKVCDIPYTTIDGWYKKGYEGLKLTTLRKLANYFDTTLDFWANDKNEKSPETGNTDSEEEFVERVKLLTAFFENAGYIAPGGDLTAEQFKVCKAFVDFLDSYFG